MTILGKPSFLLAALAVVLTTPLLLHQKCEAFHSSSPIAPRTPALLPCRTVLSASSSSRRDLFLSFGTTTGLLIVNTLLAPEQAQAVDELFRPNPLTNSILEQIRIWDQAQADELRYGGELERGDAGNQGKVDAYPRLLVPILEMSTDLQRVVELVRDGSSSSSLLEAQRILEQPMYTKVNFKKIFNAYGDNIYYSDPDRANVYLGGGATPKTEQSMAYLLRNDILTHLEDLQAEVAYILKRQQPDSNEESTDDLIQYATMASSALQLYISNIVPPSDLQKAKELLEQASST